MIESKPLESQRPLLIHPLVLYCVPWLLITPLYTLQWSVLLIYSAGKALEVALFWIVFPVIASWIYWRCLAHRAMRSYTLQAPDLSHIVKVARWLLVAWALISFVEVVVSRGVPFVWLARGEGRTAQDFGISSVHGLVNSMLLGATMLYVYAGLALRRRIFFTPIFLTLVWGVLMVSRQILMVLMVQCVLLYLQQRKVNAAKFLGWCTVGGLAVILSFGVMGDFRSPTFVKNAAGLTAAYPDWLPSGIIWVYMYATTPLNNLIHTILMSTPLYDWSFPNTAQSLFPSAVRYFIFPNLDIWSGAGGILVSQVFNVSSAYVGPVQDFGLMGTYIFSWATVGVLIYFWQRRDALGSLGYCLAGQCAFFSIFYNHFFYLPVAFQIIWFILATNKWRPAGFPLAHNQAT